MMLFVKDSTMLVGLYFTQACLLFIQYLQNRILNHMCLHTLGNNNYQEGFDADPPYLDPSAQFDSIPKLQDNLDHLGKKQAELSNIPVPTTPTLLPTPTTTPTTIPPTTITTTNTTTTNNTSTNTTTNTTPAPTSFATASPTTNSVFTPTPTPTITTTPTPKVVQPTFTSTPPVQDIYTPAPCGFVTKPNKHLQDAYDALHKYDLTGASDAITKELIRRSVYVERLQPNTSDDVKSYNIDIINKLNTILKDLKMDEPHLAEDMNTLCMIKPK